MNTRIGAAASGVVNATQSYVEGDTAMAQAHQSAAIDQVYLLTPAPGHGPVAY